MMVHHYKNRAISQIIIIANRNTKREKVSGTESGDP